MDEITDPQWVNDWMDWYSVGRLRALAPADFLGGLSTYDVTPSEGYSYFSINITEPGTYAWIIQTRDEPIWQEFTIE